MNEVEEKLLRSFLKDLVSAQFESTREAVTEQIVLLVNDFAAQQSAPPTALCTCETVDTKITKLLNDACPVHGSHSG